MCRCSRGPTRKCHSPGSLAGDSDRMCLVNCLCNRFRRNRCRDRGRVLSSEDLAGQNGNEKEIPLHDWLMSFYEVCRKKIGV